MRYRINYTETARKELQRLPGYVRQRARRIIERLADNPRPIDAKELRERPAYYRIRLVKWRIIYRVDDDQTVLILRARLKTGPETYEDIE